MVGLTKVHEAKKSKQRLERLLEHVHVWPIELSAATEFAVAFHEARTTGRILSHPDLLLIALARLFDATILTTDLDFRAFPDIRTENWQ